MLEISCEKVSRKFVFTVVVTENKACQYAQFKRSRSLPELTCGLRTTVPKFGVYCSVQHYCAQALRFGIHRSSSNTPAVSAL